MNIERAMKEARSAISQDDHERARGVLVKILNEDLRNIEAWILLADLMDELEDVIYCLKQAAQIDASAVPLSNQLSRLEASLPYYNEITHIASGYGEWATKSDEPGLQHFSIEYNSESEAKALLTTLKRQITDIKDVSRHLASDDKVYVSNYNVFTAMVLGSNLRNQYQSEAEYKLDISLSRSAMLTFCSQALKGFQQAKSQIEDYLNPKPEKRGREPIPKDVKMYVWRRDKGRCVNCGSQEKLEYDHIIPLSKGGSNTARNLQILCESCNRSKGANIA